jgi:hemerythrin-like domain-containing protein
LPTDAAAQTTEANGRQDGAGEDVSATEDLMREHGVLRRTLIVYSELGERLRATNLRQLDTGALAEAAKLFQQFGKQYREKMLEEQYVFPETRRDSGPNEKLVEVLLTQHQRGREITAYLQRIGTRGQIGGDAKPLANALKSMARMYHAHSAWEDTVIFPAWKKTQPKSRLDEMAENFEEIEHQQFGKASTTPWSESPKSSKRSASLISRITRLLRRGLFVRKSIAGLSRHAPERTRSTMRSVIAEIASRAS